MDEVLDDPVSKSNDKSAEYFSGDPKNRAKYELEEIELEEFELLSLDEENEDDEVMLLDDIDELKDEDENTIDELLD